MLWIPCVRFSFYASFHVADKSHTFEEYGLLRRGLPLSRTAAVASCGATRAAESACSASSSICGASSLRSITCMNCGAWIASPSGVAWQAAAGNCFRATLAAEAQKRLNPPLVSGSSVPSDSGPDPLHNFICLRRRFSME